jgi:hypothetical protein
VSLLFEAGFFDAGVVAESAGAETSVLAAAAVAATAAAAAVTAAAASALFALDDLAAGAAVELTVVESASVSALSVESAAARVFAFGAAAEFAALVAVKGCLLRFTALTFALAPAGVLAPEFDAFAGLVPAFAAPADCQLALPVDPPEPLGGAGVWAGDGLVFGLLSVASASGDACGGCDACGGLAGADGVLAAAVADPVASSSAANGVSPSGSLSWLSVDGCGRGDDSSEAAAARSDAILGILGTPGSDINKCLLATAGPAGRSP